MSKESEDFLSHHGVLGMKWGQHKSKAQFRDSTTGSVTKKRYPVTSSHDHVHTQELKKKPLHSLSTVEVKKLNDRLQTEQQYKKLNPGTMSRGKKALIGVIGGIGVGITVYNQVKSPAGKDAIALGKKTLGKVLAKYSIPAVEIIGSI